MSSRKKNKRKNNRKNSMNEFKTQQRKKDIIFVVVIIILTIGLAGGFYFLSDHWSDETADHDDVEIITNHDDQPQDIDQNGNEKNEIEWHTYENGLALAKANNKHVLIDFYYDTCYYCILMEDNTYPNQNVIDLSKEFVCVKVDLYEKEAYDGEQLTKDYGITGYPTIVYLDSLGKEIYRVPGYREAEEFIGDMDNALSLS